jgi:FixJ family two-component response regulator
MPGDKLAKKLTAIRSDIPIILATGFSEQVTEKAAKALGIKALLMKPVAINQLAETVRKALKKDFQTPLEKEIDS